MSSLFKLRSSDCPDQALSVGNGFYVLDADRNEIELYVDDPEVDWEEDPAAVLSPIKPLDL